METTKIYSVSFEERHEAPFDVATFNTRAQAESFLALLITKEAELLRTSRFCHYEDGKLEIRETILDDDSDIQNLYLSILESNKEPSVPPGFKLDLIAYHAGYTDEEDDEEVTAAPYTSVTVCLRCKHLMSEHIDAMCPVGLVAPHVPERPFILDPKYYPSADEWMWNYCTYLGNYTDEYGDEYDLGIFIDNNGKSPMYCDASVYGDFAGEYSSGDLQSGSSEVCLRKQEVYRRAKLLNII